MEPGGVAQSFNPSIPEAEAGGALDFEVSLVYRVVVPGQRYPDLKRREEVNVLSPFSSIYQKNEKFKIKKSNQQLVTSL